jgi:hypothetical protein
MWMIEIKLFRDNERTGYEIIKILCVHSSDRETMEKN